MLPSGIFQSDSDAIGWITTNRLSGTLTEYPVGISVYDWVISHGYMKPRENPSAKFLESFSSASMRHFHFEHGVCSELSD